MSDALIKSKYLTRRSFVFKGLQFAALSTFIARMFFLQIVNGKKYAALAENNKNRIFLERPIRGLILDCMGVSIAENELSYRVLFNTSKVNKILIDDVFSTISGLLDKEINPSLKDRVKRKKSGIFVLYKKISWDDLSKIELYAPNLYGIYVTPFYNRRYNFSQSCSHIVGYVKEESIKDEKSRLEMDVGVAGIELSHDEELRGVPGISICEVDARGKNARELSHVQSQKGSDMQLTINAHLQEEVYRLLDGQKGAVVIVEIQTGDVLVLCSSPSYDNNKFISGFSGDEWRELSGSKDLHFLNRAVAAPVQPASTFKTITAMAALKSKLIVPETTFYCDGGITFGGRLFKCWRQDGHGEVNVHGALVNSCNVFFYEVGKKINMEVLTSVASQFSLGEQFNLGLGTESAGVLPTKEWKYNNAIMDWSIGDTMNVVIGQGMVSVPVLNLAIQAARIATKKKVIPNLIRSAEIREFDPIDIDDKVLSVVRNAMFQVVNSGTASYLARYLQHGKLDMAGKTGTVQDGVVGSKNHGLFISYYPYSKPKYAAAVFLEESGGSGSAVALFRKIMPVFKSYYGL